jgi:hypothetical protein
MPNFVSIDTDYLDFFFGLIPSGPGPKGGCDAPKWIGTEEPQRAWSNGATGPRLAWLSAVARTARPIATNYISG